MIFADKNAQRKDGTGIKKRRVTLKLSGEAPANTNGKGYDEAVVWDIVRQVKRPVDAGVEVGIVIGGGNYWRGRVGTKTARVKADQIGMLVTAMNYIHVSEIFRDEGMGTETFSPLLCGAVTELFSVDKANALSVAGRVLFFAGGTGHPYFSADTGIALRATEFGVDEILLARSIDGVYIADPKLDPDAKCYDTLTMQEMIDKKLGITGLTASVLCMEDKIPFTISDLYSDNAIAGVLRGVIHGTTVTV